MQPIRVFYDDMYIYQEVSQPIEGQSIPLVIKIGVGTKPEYQALASHIEQLYEQAFQPKQDGAEPALSPFQNGAASSILPPEYYAEQTILVSKRGNVYHLEYHSFPEPELYVCCEIKDTPARNEKVVSTSAYLCDQLYSADGKDYVVTSLKGNYANFPQYSPFFLDKEKYRTFVFDRQALIESGAVFSDPPKGLGQKIDLLGWFREKFIPAFLAGCWEFPFRSERYILAK